MSSATQSNITLTTTSSGYQSKSVEVQEFSYEKSKIPQYMIDECEKRSHEIEEVCFIFDNSISNLIKNRYLNDKVEKREILIDQVLEEGEENIEKYHIGSELYFKEMPSRFSYYDTETKETDRYKKYKIVTDFLNKLGFSPNIEFNFGPEYDQSYLLRINEKSFIARVKPNLFLTIQEGFTEEGSPNNIFDGFFNRSKIIDGFKLYPDIFSIIRDIKLEQILQ
jgi:hypothetical protein